MNKNAFKCTLKGLVRACIITLLGTIIFSIINFFIPTSDGVRGTFILLITLLSIMYGSVYAARKSTKQGWIIGLFLALMYMIIFYIIAVIAGRDAALCERCYIRVILAVLVGILSGMLGINM